MALGLSILLWIYFWVIGYPIVSALFTRRDLVRSALVAPAAGIALTICSAYLLSRLGLPVRAFAHALAAIMLLVSGSIWILRKPLLPIGHLAPYALILVFGFILTGWPLLLRGFGWLGNLNQDMMHYVLGAQRLVDQAYVQWPDPGVWLTFSDSTAYFARFAAGGMRQGCELLLAWTIAVTGMDGLSVYMPVLMTAHAALISTATAMISRPYRYARILAVVLMSCAAMLSVSATLQLLPQILGLMLFALAVVTWFWPFYRLARGAAWRFILLAAVFSAALLLTYPEVLLFFAIAFVVYHAFFVREVSIFLGPALVSVVAAAIIAAALIAPDLLALINFLLDSASSANTDKQLLIQFPYFLVPTGLAALWGLIRFAGDQGPAVSSAIVVGAMLTLAGVAGTCWLALRREPAAVVTAVMFALASYLFGTNNGFGTLKIALYIQPYLLPTSALAICLVLRAAR